MYNLENLNEVSFEFPDSSLKNVSCVEFEPSVTVLNCSVNHETEFWEEGDGHVKVTPGRETRLNGDVRYTSRKETGVRDGETLGSQDTVYSFVSTSLLSYTSPSREGTHRGMECG